MSENDPLMSRPKESYGDSYTADYLAMYNDFVLSADKISARRYQTNSFFLTVNTALITIAGTLLTAALADFLWIVGFAGIAFCYYWRQLIGSYRSLNTAKFQVIHQMEEHLPMAPYRAEWDMLEKGKNEDVHVPFSAIESNVPRVFMALHGIVALISLVRLIG